MKHHFTRVAPRYRRMRELDVTAARDIAQIIGRLPKSDLPIVILDVGSGTGRYLEAVLAESALETTHRCCAIRYDALREMLGGTSAWSGSPCRSVKSAVGLAESLPFATDAIDAVLVFNAIHHFDTTPFMTEVGRVLRPDGKVIIYTRTPKQNRCTIWGRFFPLFADKESRLLTEAALTAAVDQTGAFGTVELRVIPWSTEANLSRLIEQARCGAYSTFEFYSLREFADAVATFERRLLEHFEDPSRIVVQNDHLLAVATRRLMP
jgi:SAM-dependent methyltransferase